MKNMKLLKVTGLKLEYLVLVTKAGLLVVLIKSRIVVNKKLALGYTYWNDKIDYTVNREAFESNNCKVIEVDEAALRENFELSLSKDIQGVTGKVFIDISVMTRHRLSELLWFLFDNMISGSAIVVSYSIAEFVSPPKKNYPIKFFGSIIENFQPMAGRLNLHPVVIIGLGYEKDKALGAIGHLDPEDVIFFNSFK